MWPFGRNYHAITVVLVLLGTLSGKDSMSTVTPGGYKCGAIRLYPKDKLIAKELLTGKNNVEIAAALAMKVRTVKWHIERIYEFTGVQSRLQYMALMMVPRKDFQTKVA
jgi:DNA-binding CsgD family transcriptional regulator